jgi:hypothetical protein
LNHAEIFAAEHGLYEDYMLYNFSQREFIADLRPHLPYHETVYYFCTGQAMVVTFQDGSAIVDNTAGPWEFRAYGCRHACPLSRGCQCNAHLISAVVDADNIVWGTGNTDQEALVDAVQNGLEPDEQISILAAEADLREVVQTLGGSETAWWYRDVTPTKTVLRLRRNQPLPT